MASQKRNSESSNPGRKNSKKKIFTGVESALAITSVFEGSSDLIPGELIVQLEEQAAASITESISRGSSAAAMSAGVNAFGIANLDKVLSEIGATSITRLHPPAATAAMAMSEEANKEARCLATTFKVCCDRTGSVEEAAEKLASAAGVRYAEPNRYRETYVTPNDPRFASQWGLGKINAPAAWERTTGSPNVVVAVIDTGIDLDHPELASLLVQGMDMVDLGPNPKAPAGFRFEGDFQTRDNVPQDEVGHGTHVAGTIACLSNNNRDVAGVTWQCRLMPVKVLTRLVNISKPIDVRGIGSSADIAAGIRWAVDNGARVLNLSLGSETDAQVERDAIAYAIARGAVVCAAMGNGGVNAPISYPAAYPGVVAVGAINISNQRAGFSQVGAHIDVVAPGVDILSTVWNDSVGTMSGTSMASPHVAGVAALVLSCNSSLTGDQVADILRQTAQPLRDAPGDPIPNNTYGFGCIDARAALERACPQPVVSRTVICERPSVLVRCPSTEIRCSRPILCEAPSVVVKCPPSRPVICISRTIRCPQPLEASDMATTTPVACVNTSPVTCAPSLPVVCSSNLVVCNPRSTLIRCVTRDVSCLRTIPITCRQTRVICASTPINCGQIPIRTTLCGPLESMACRIDDIPRPDPGRGMGGGFEEPDQMEGWSAYDEWAGYDPYGTYLEEDYLY